MRRFGQGLTVRRGALSPCLRLHWLLTTIRVPLATILSPHAPRSSGAAVDAVRRAGYSTPTRQASTCYEKETVAR